MREMTEGICSKLSKFKRDGRLDVQYSDTEIKFFDTTTGSLLLKLDDTDLIKVRVEHWSN